MKAVRGVDLVERRAMTASQIGRGPQVVVRVIVGKRQVSSVPQPNEPEPEGGDGGQQPAAGAEAAPHEAAGSRHRLGHLGAPSLFEGPLAMHGTL